MTTLYVLGAGCSRNYTQSTSTVPRLKPPLNNDFFQMAKRVIEHYPQLVGPSGVLGIHGWGHFVEDLSSLYGYTRRENGEAVLDDPRLTLETVMNHFYLEKELLEYDFGFSARRRTSLLNELLALVLEESLRGGACPKHAALAQLMQKGDVVFNMNYDLLMDNALYDASKLTDSGYLIRFDYTLKDDAWNRIVDSDTTVVMMKLHGSLNWVRCENCGRNLLLRKQKSAGPNWYETNFLSVRCPACNSQPFNGLERILVPPAGVKDTSNRDIKYLWTRTLTHCKDIGRIVVIGYSFAQTDAEVEMLFRTMVKERILRRDVPVLIVNKHPRPVKSRFQNIFDGKNIKGRKSLNLFLKHPSGLR